MWGRSPACFKGRPPGRYAARNCPLRSGVPPAYNAVHEVRAPSSCFSIVTCRQPAVNRRARCRTTVAALCPPRARVVVAAGRRGRRLPGTDPRDVHAAPIPAGRSPAPARRSAIAAGVVGAWIADLLLYLFGAVGVVVRDRRRRARGRRLPPRRAARGKRRASAFVLACMGFALVIVASAALEALRVLWKHRRRRCRCAPAARSAT